MNKSIKYLALLLIIIMPIAAYADGRVRFNIEFQVLIVILSWEQNLFHHTSRLMVQMELLQTNLIPRASALSLFTMSVTMA